MTKITTTAHTDMDQNPYVGWQIPATGNFNLEEGGVKEFASFLEQFDSDSWMSMILVGEDPQEVAQELRKAYRDAERQAEKRQRQAEELREKYQVE